MENQASGYQKSPDGESKTLTAMQRKLKDPPADHSERGKGMTRKIFMKKKRPVSEKLKTKGKNKYVRKSMATIKDDGIFDESDDKVDVGTAIENGVDGNNGKDTSVCKERSIREMNDTTIKNTVELNSLASIIVELVINNSRDRICNTQAELNAVNALDVDDMKKSPVKGNDADDKDDVTFTNEDPSGVNSTTEHIHESDGNIGVDIRIKSDNKVSNDQDVNIVAAMIIKLVINNSRDCICNTQAELNAVNALDVDDMKRRPVKKNDADDIDDVTFTNEDLPGTNSTAEQIDESDGNIVSDDQGVTTKNDHPNTESLDDIFVNVKSGVNSKYEIDVTEENKPIVNNKNVTVQDGSVNVHGVSYSAICDNPCVNGYENGIKQENNDSDKMLFVMRYDETDPNNLCDLASDGKDYASCGDDLPMKYKVGVTDELVNSIPYLLPGAKTLDDFIINDRSDENTDYHFVENKEIISKEKDADHTNSVDHVVDYDSDDNSGVDIRVKCDNNFSDSEEFTTKNNHPNKENSDDIFVNVTPDVNSKDDVDFGPSVNSVSVKECVVDAYDVNESTIYDYTGVKEDVNGVQKKNNDADEMICAMKDDEVNHKNVCILTCDDKCYVSNRIDLTLTSEVGLTNEVVYIVRSRSTTADDFGINNKSDVNGDDLLFKSKANVGEEKGLITADSAADDLEDFVNLVHTEIGCNERDIPTVSEELSNSGVEDFNKDYEGNIKEADNIGKIMYMSANDQVKSNDNTTIDETSNDTVSVSVTCEDNIEEDLNLQNKVDINGRKIEDIKDDIKYMEEYTFSEDVNERVSLISVFLKKECETEYRLLSSIKPYVENKDQGGCGVDCEETEIKTEEKSRKCVNKKERSRLRRWFRRVRSGIRHFCCMGSKEEL